MVELDVGMVVLVVLLCCGLAGVIAAFALRSMTFEEIRAAFRRPTSDGAGALPLGVCAGAKSDYSIEIIRRVLAEGPGAYGVFKLVNNERFWVGYSPGEVTLAYPFSNADRLSAFSGRALPEWEPHNFITMELAERDPVRIGEWIDTYFREVLRCPEGYSIVAEITE